MSCYYHEEKDKINIAPYPVLRMLKVLYTFMDIRSVFLVVIIPTDSFRSGAHSSAAFSTAV